MMTTSTTKKPPSTNSNEVDNNNIAYGMPTPTNHNTENRLGQIDELKLFLATATQQWDANKSLKRFVLPAGESVSCVLWNDLFFITGTDIVRSLTFRFYAFGRPVTNAKKFEEGIFSDLRNLKPGNDARLEEPKSELLDMLYKNNCIRTQKKQKVFFWFSVPHDRLFLDALERDLKREKMGMEPTTQAIAEPASSLSLDSTQELFDQLRKTMSQSAAATAQAIEEEVITTTPVIPNSSLSMNHVSDYENWSSSATGSPTSTTNHIPWSASQSRLERAASQAIKRSRVNSVPASIGQQQQFQLLQQQKQNRLSHGSYFSNKKYNTTNNRHSVPNGTSSSSSLLSSNRHHHEDSSSYFSELSNGGSSCSKFNHHHRHHHQQQQQSQNIHDYMDPISNGVDQLEITSSLSTQSTSSQVSHNNVLPSKSLDSNAMKKTKTIFGNLSLFDGSPTYKQRRRRAASVSNSSILNNGVRRHDKCHLRNTTNTTTNTPNATTPPTSVSNATPTVPILNNNSSRLAMAAVKAGFAPNQIITNNNTMNTMLPTNHWSTPHHHSNQQQQQQQVIDYLCPMTNCGRLFKRSDHLERHMNTIHTFICNLCGKQFNRSEILAQHHRLEHHHDTSSSVHMIYNSDNNNNDDDSSPDQRHFQNLSQYHRHHNQQQGGNGVLTHHDGFYSSPRHSFDGSRSSGWSTNISNHTNTTTISSQSSSHSSIHGNNNSHSNSSRCSTLSPMLDIDFDMPDVQHQFHQQQQLQLQHPSHQISHSTESLNKIIEDDFSSSSASSPSSTLQQYNNNMTLLSSFKPIQHQHQQQQQHLHDMNILQQQQSNMNNVMSTEEYHPSFNNNGDVSMLLPTDYSTNNSYAPFDQQQYTPFITSPDMNLVFGA